MNASMAKELTDKANLAADKKLKLQEEKAKKEKEEYKLNILPKILEKELSIIDIKIENAAY